MTRPYQHIQAVRVSAATSHTIVIETFVSDPVNDRLWRITAVYEVTPYREWIIERTAVDAIKTTDARTDKEPVVIHGPVAHHADAAAEKRFRRSVNGRPPRPPAPAEPDT